MFPLFIFKIFLLLHTLTLNTECARILGIFNYPSKSHHILGEALLKALAARGHEVTMVSPYPSSKPIQNYEEIILNGIADYKYDNVAQGITEMQELSWFPRIIKMRRFILQNDKLFLDHVKFEQLLTASNQTFDLVIQNWLFNSATLGIAHHFKCPVIAFSTFGSTMFLNSITGNSLPYSYVPNIFLSFPNEMDFIQRLGNTVGTLIFEYFEYLDFSLHQRHLNQYFPKAPPLEELLKNVSLTLVNSHFSIESSRPYLPSMIPIGGFHLDSPKKELELNEEFKDFIDGAKEGILYFSFGTNVKAVGLPKAKIEAILKVFSKISLRVLWKFENEEIQNLPSNVKVSKWFPQKQILAHANTKIFVSHGGLLSTTEAIYYGVPIIGIPFFADQEYNIADSVSKGYAIQISYQDLSEDTLLKAITDMLESSSYRENIKMRSMALRDQPLTPMDNAIFWIEYVIRHKGAPLLKSAALNLKWYQYFLVDVIMFLVGIFLFIITCTFLIVKSIKSIIIKLICKKLNKSKEE